jgi:hypothetical protein
LRVALSAVHTDEQITQLLGGLDALGLIPALSAPAALS